MPIYLAPRDGSNPSIVIVEKGLEVIDKLEMIRTRLDNFPLGLSYEITFNSDGDINLYYNFYRGFGDTITEMKGVADSCCRATNKATAEEWIKELGEAVDLEINGKCHS